MHTTQQPQRVTTVTHDNSWLEGAGLEPPTSLFVCLCCLSEMYGSEDGAVPATFEILYMIGWKPHESQVIV